MRGHSAASGTRVAGVARTCEEPQHCLHLVQEQLAQLLLAGHAQVLAGTRQLLRRGFQHDQPQGSGHRRLDQLRGTREQCDDSIH